MTEELYTLVIRPDMPQGYIKNDRYPEIPATREYLERFLGRTFSLDNFRTEIQGWRAHLTLKGITDRGAVDFNTGVTIFERNAIGVFVSGPPGRCEFGWLEKTIQ